LRDVVDALTRKEDIKLAGEAGLAVTEQAERFDVAH